MELPCVRCGEAVFFEYVGDADIAAQSWAEDRFRPFCRVCGEAEGLTLKIDPNGYFE